MKSSTRKFLLLLLSFGLGLTALAQTTIKGVVTDTNGEPIIGGGVMVEGTTTGTITGLDGDYTLTVPEGATNLVFSCIGMAEQTVCIGNLHTAEDQLSVFRKAVHVVAVSDSNQASSLLLKMLSASTTSTGVVSLMFSRLPSTICTSPPMFSMSEQSSVTTLRSSASVSAKV